MPPPAADTGFKVTTRYTALPPSKDNMEHPCTVPLIPPLRSRKPGKCGKASILAVSQTVKLGNGAFAWQRIVQSGELHVCQVHATILLGEKKLRTVLRRAERLRMRAGRAPTTAVVL